MGDLEEEVWDGRCIPYRLVLITLSVDKSTSRSVAWSVSGSGGQQEHIHERGETKKKEWSPSASLSVTQVSNRLLGRVISQLHGSRIRASSWRYPRSFIRDNPRLFASFEPVYIIIRSLIRNT